jgi:hypothetical protein
MENETYIVRMERLDFERPCGICETTIKVGDLAGDIRYPDGTGEHVCENCASKYPTKSE